MRPWPMPWHPVERRALVDALTAAGPGAPTRCAGWLTEHLAAHVVLRERSLLAAAGVVGGPLAARTERLTTVRGEAMARDWPGTLDVVAAGAPVWSPLAWAGDGAQLVELFVHAEDVRRGPGRDSAPVRRLPAGEQAALWRTLARVGRWLYRDSPVGVVLTDGTRTVRVRAVPGSSGPSGRDVVVRGEIGELVLHAWGRSTVAEVQLDGEAAAVAALAAVRPG